MGSSDTSGTALVAAAADADPVTRLVLGWLAGKRSVNTRTAYARDIGITPQRRAGHAPSWLDWCQAEGVHPVTGVTGLHVALYARQLDAAELSPASVARKLTAVSGWYAWLARRGHIAASPAEGIARPRRAAESPATPGLTRDQALRVVHAADTAPGPRRARTAALVAVLLFTGVRVSEAIGADVADVGTAHGRRALRVTRGDGRGRIVPLPGPAAVRLDAYFAERSDLTARRPRGGQQAGGPDKAGDAPLFATATGRRLYAADVWRLVRRLAAQAGLPGDLADHLGPEAMRHSFAALYLDAGGSLSDLQHVMGHADPRTTRRYDRSRQVTDCSPGDVVAAYLAARAARSRPRTTARSGPSARRRA
jgi:site-specific recombinase XerD